MTNPCHPLSSCAQGTQRGLFQWLLGVFALTVAFQALAFPEGDVADSVDFPNIDRFPDSVITRSEAAESQRFVVALGKMKKTAGRWGAEEQRVVIGAWQSLTYRAPDRSRSLEVFDYLVDQLKRQGVNADYQCSGSGCGRSNAWANTVFSEKRLYGPNAGQHYFTGNVDGMQWMVYAIKRGNKRVYLRVDRLVLPEQSGSAGRSDGLSKPLLVFKKGRATLAQNTIRDKNWFAALRAAMGPEKRLRIVAHQYNSTGDGTAHSVEALLSASQRAAESLRDELLQAGVSANKVSAYGVGPLAPEANGDRRARFDLFVLDAD